MNKINLTKLAARIGKGALVAATICAAVMPSFAANEPDTYTVRLGSDGEIINADLPSGALPMEPSAYVQTGLVGHFDGIRNAGLGQAHDSSATTWVNLGSGGSANDATLGELSSNIPSGATNGEWTDSGYYFKGKHYFGIGGTINLDKAATVQLATEWTTTIGDCANYPLIIGGSSSDNDYFGIWHDKNALAVNFKVLDNKKSAAASHWDGYFLNAVYDGANSRYSLTKNTSYNWLTGGANGSIKASNTQYVIGTAQKSDSGKGPRMFKGIIRSVRIYDRILTTDELDWNRVVDDIRFRGLVTNATVIVATNRDGAEGTEPSGKYFVNGSHTFTAPATATVGGRTWKLLGYSLQTYDTATGTWVSDGEGVHEASSFSYTNCLANTGARITWEWFPTPTGGSEEPNRYVQYVQSTGAQWIELVDFTQSRDIKFDADIDWLSGQTFIGQGHYGQRAFTVESGTIRCRWYMNDGWTPADTEVAPGSGRHRFVLTGKNRDYLYVSVDGGGPRKSGNTSTRTDMGETLTRSLYLFANHNGTGEGSVNEQSSVRVYSLKIYDGSGTIVRDFVPGVKDGVAGLYDIQNDKWYQSQSTTALVAGPGVSRNNTPDKILEYVESNGHQWVDVGAIPQTKAMTFDADIAWMDGAAANASFLAQSHNGRNVFIVQGSNPQTIKCYWTMDTGPADTGVTPNGERHRFVVSTSGTKLTVTVDGGSPISSSSNVGTPPQSTKTLYLFAQHQGDGTALANYSSVKLYGLKIYGQYGEPLRDFVPGLKDDVAGLYDKVEDKWYYSGSGTALIPGPVANPQNLPDVYLDYVKSTGAQWVDTGFMPSRTMTADADLDWISGTAVLSQNNYDIRVLSANNGKIAGSTYSYSSYATTDVPLDTGRHRVVVRSVDGQKLTVSVDGAEPAVAGDASNRSCTPPSLYLFAAHSGGGTSYSDPSTVKLYGLKIYGANGALARDYVPGIKDNVVGLYDRVGDKFYSSGTATPLEAGPVVDRSKPDAFVEYVSSSGSQWVDTGVDGRANIKSEMDAEWTEGNCLLGSYGGGGNHNLCELLQNLSGIGGQAGNSGEAKSYVSLNAVRHLMVSEAMGGEKFKVTVDGGTPATSGGNVSTGLNNGCRIWVFASNNSGNAWGNSKGKVYGLKLWRTGSDGVCRLQRHFIPCVKGGRAGLYDAVSGVIFYSHSGTDLTASPTTRTLSVWRNEADDASLDNAANWCGGLPDGTDAVVCAPWLQTVSTANDLVCANLTVHNGAAIDLSGHTLTLSGLTGANSGSFASGAAITVDLSGRTDLKTIAKSANPYIVTWDSQPDATFTLDATTGRKFKIQPDGTGLKISIRASGVMIIAY